MTSGGVSENQDALHVAGAGDRIEVQVLDLGCETNWLREKGKHSDWFTSHGDVFPVGQASMTAFTPEISYTAEDGTRFTCGNQKSSRCFPTKRLTKPAGEWNHYYVRAIQGEVRLWVNGEEVSGGTKRTPSQGYLALEAGARIEYLNLRLRELPWSQRRSPIVTRAWGVIALRRK